MKVNKLIELVKQYDDLKVKIDSDNDSLDVLHHVPDRTNDDGTPFYEYIGWVFLKTQNVAYIGVKYSKYTPIYRAILEFSLTSIDKRGLKDVDLSEFI